MSDAKSSSYHAVAMQLADLVVEKQAAYGDSFGKSGELMRLLYPSGVKLEQLDDALTVVRVIDKLFRIATARDALGESPWRDVQGYALLAVERIERPPARGPLVHLAVYKGNDSGKGANAACGNDAGVDLLCWHRPKVTCEVCLHGRSG